MTNCQSSPFDCGPSPITNSLCPITVNAKCVPYTGSALSCIGVDTNDKLDVILGKINDTVCNIGAGAGSLTNFSSGNLSPLFTTSVATPSSTPALTFILTNAASNTVFGNFTALSAAPSYNAATVDNRFLVRRSGTLQFGPLLYTDIPLTFVNGLTNTTGTVRLGGALTASTIIDGTSLYNLTLTDGNLIVKGVYTVGAAIPAYTEAQMFFYPKKAAFRAGQGSTGQWNDANVGLFSFAFGANNTCTGNYSASWGTANLSSGVLSTTFGNGNVASGSRSVAFGQTNISSGYTSVAWGEVCAASAHYATASGIGSETYSYAGTVIGQYNDNTLTANPTSFHVSNRAFEIGIGTSDGTRLNAVTTLFSGNTGFGLLTPTAIIHIKAGTAAANTAPFKLTSGTNLTTPEAGATEFDGTALYFTPSTVRNTVLMAPAINAVSPTAPDVTIPVVIGGVTYYIHAKTTND